MKYAAKAFIKLATVSLILILLMFNFVLIRAAPEEMNFGYKVKNNIIFVETPFYKLTLNLSKGVSITKITFKNGNKTLDLSSCLASYPTLLFFMRTRNVSHKYEIKIDNKTYYITYPSSLSLYPWRLVSATKQDGHIILTLEPTEEAEYDVSPLLIMLKVDIYYYNPTINFTLEVTNPSESPITLYGNETNGTLYGPGIGVVLCKTVASGWTQGVLTLNKNNLSIKILSLTNLSKITKFNNIKMAFLYAPQKSPLPLYIVALRPRFPNPEGITGFSSIILKSVEPKEKSKKITAYSEILIYRPISLKPGGKAVLNLNLVLAHTPDPASIFVYNLNDFYYAWNRFTFNYDLNQTFKFGEMSKNLTILKEINKNLKKEISSLEEKCNNLTKQLGEVEGQLTYFKTNNKIISNNFAQLSSELKKCSRKEVGLFIFGLLIGVFGGWLAYATRIRFKGTRK